MFLKTYARQWVLQYVQYFGPSAHEDYETKMMAFFLSNKNEKRLVRFEIVSPSKIRIHHNVMKPQDQFYILRAEAIRDMFLSFKLNFGKIKNFYLYLGDEMTKKYEDYPLFVFSKRAKQKGILVPDWSFWDNYTSSNKKQTWDDLKQKTYNMCPVGVPPKNIFYFRGRNTSSIAPHNIREEIQKISTKLPYIDINLNPQNVQSLSDWCPNRYMLDLPGSSPWSVRFKELFLLRSVIVKVDVFPSDDFTNPHINFYTPLLKAGVDYVSIPFNYNDPDRISKLENSLRRIHGGFQTETYLTMVRNGRTTINKLTLPAIGEYMQEIFHAMSGAVVAATATKVLDASRPCSSKSRKNERYTRSELVALMAVHSPGVKTSAMSIDTMCGILSSPQPKPQSPPKPMPQPMPPMELLAKTFLIEFKAELTDWFMEPTSKTALMGYRCLMKGGQNLKRVMENKYHFTPPGGWKTKDYDFSVGVEEIRTPRVDLVIQYFKIKMSAFASKHPALSFRIRDFGAGLTIGSNEKFTKFATLQLMYNADGKREDFVDICINSGKIYKTSLDKPLSEKLGLPIQTMKATFKELSSLLYGQIGSPGNSLYAYRNPFYGRKPSKGVKDLNRFQMVCNKTHYKPQCNVIKELEAIGFKFPIEDKFITDLPANVKSDLQKYTRDIIFNNLG